MDIKDTLFALVFSGIFVTSVLLVLFGQITVRKLRKNPETKDSLGISLASGWDIINVASALCAPKWYRERVKKSPMAAFSADYELLYKHTTLFDRVLGRAFWGLAVGSTFSLILFGLLDDFGVFE
jgi:uncharacterized membrane-anchored protein